MRRRLRTCLALLGCFAGLVGPVAGAEKADRAATAGTEERSRLERRIDSLRQERRMRHRTTDLLSEVALFDAGMALGRSVAVTAGDNRGALPPPTLARGPESVAQRERTGLAGTGPTISEGDIEGLDSEIRDLVVRLRAVKRGARRPGGAFCDGALTSCGGIHQGSDLPGISLR